MDVDTETSLLIASLVLQDIAEIEGRRKGKRHEHSPLTDEELSFALQEQQLRDLLTSFQDFRFAHGLDAALATDQHLVDAFNTAEMSAQDDRLAALAVSQGRPIPAKTAAQRLVESRTFTTEFTTDIHPPTPTSPGPIIRPPPPWLAEEEAPASEPLILTSPTSSMHTLQSMRHRDRNCVSCMEPVSRHDLTALCAHDWCYSCVVDLVTACTKDESLYPLRCCGQNFDERRILAMLKDANLRSLFQRKAEEFGTPALQRVYCPRPQCSAFMGKSSGGQATKACHRCRADVCMACKSLAHAGEACGEAAAVTELRELAQRNNWQTCPGCHAIVELHHGCYHMTCRCRTQFCYVCAVPWKNCGCPQWDEIRLLDTAQQRVANELGARAVAAQPAAYQEQVWRAVAHLRDNHDCVNHSWRSRSGGGMCDHCSQYLPVYLRQCRNCRILACRRCSLNRL